MIPTLSCRDYAGDGYVHRLIQNKTDGKLVEVPSRHQSTDDRSGSVAAVPDGEYDKEWVGKSDMTKAEAISLEYQYLLTAQLETQRAYFEEQMQMIEKQKEYKIKVSICCRVSLAYTSIHTTCL